MSDEPKRLVEEDPGFARLVAASRGDGPSRAELDELVNLSTRMVSASRWRAWSWLGVKTALVAASVLAVVVATNRWTGNRETTHAPVVSPVMAPMFEPGAPAVGGADERPVTARETARAPAVADGPAAATVMPPTSSPRTPATAAVAHSAKPAVPDVRAPRAPVSESESSTFDEELALLTAARSGLHSQDIPSCLQAIERYERRFGTGLFAEEMQVIRIDALASSGERTRAHALAQKFLTQNPTSAYAGRVGSLAERTRE